jgi:hypothetical protein
LPEGKLARSEASDTRGQRKAATFAMTVSKADYTPAGARVNLESTLYDGLSRAFSAAPCQRYSPIVSSAATLAES